MQPPEPGFRSGFVAVVGRPNVGKSALVNRLVGEKVSIVSDKPQTTRHPLRGVVHRPGAQLVLLDTPGLHKPRHLLGEHMVRAARRALREVDAILFVVDAAAGPTAADRRVAAEVASAAAPVVVALNKVDLLGGGRLDPEGLAPWRQLGEGWDLFPVSALTGAGVEGLGEALAARLPPGPAYFPPGQVTDQPEQLLCAELIREKILLLTREEVPHSVAVEIEAFARRPDRDLVEIRATVYVERESQKGILIGRSGRMLKEVGRLAREEIEALLGSPVYLELWVKVKEGWRTRAGSLQELGFR